MTHPTIEAIRETRREIAREHGYDMDRLFDFYQQLDEERGTAGQSAEETEGGGDMQAKLRRIVDVLREREREARHEGLHELADKLAGDRASLAGLMRQVGTREGGQEPTKVQGS